eukprot:TRINITY_DN35476_c0_g1_i1.p1 TRINITY_DN35476_c0_g1~~TRINITY_DN35476_c0_g1_i1.p1  ORF type:complete len:182 (+),score=34.41 TRINITY_DN35476_c0_g1_i1:32-547(+)
MAKALTKASTFWITGKAKKEFASLGDDINSLSNTVEGRAKWVLNKLKGKLKKPLPDLLKEFELPVGLFPKDVTNYDFDGTRNKLTVYIPSICEVCFKDSSVIRYSTRVTCFLDKGKITGIEGMKTKVVIWVKVSAISVDGLTKLNFTAGVKKSRPRDAYDLVREGVPVEEF